MKRNAIVLFLMCVSFFANGQSIDAPYAQDKMKSDLEVFKRISIEANSGLYKYRSKQEIDSIYHWADNQIEQLTSYRDFYNLICTLSDFEGSCHNNVSLPKKYLEALRNETDGYFPFPIKWIDGKWLVNIDNQEIPLGAEIVSINAVPISEIIPNLYKYYTTDGRNVTGKRIGLRASFSKYYRLHYGLTQTFDVKYIDPNSKQHETKQLRSIGYKAYYANFRQIHSMPLDKLYYADLEEDQKYSYEQLDAHTGVLTIHTFSMGSETTERHKKYVHFLDSVFSDMKAKGIEHLIVDVRNNGGGTDPNDLVTYSYLTDRTFQENKEAWVRFKKIPLLKYYDSKVPRCIRPLALGPLNREFRTIFPVEKNGQFYQDEHSDDHTIRAPHQNAFTGTVYLLISPAIASAGSLFAAMVAGNENTITIGEETMGGYYGHNGHTPLSYKLPRSKMVVTFSAVNLEQDVPKREKQKYDRGINPDYPVSQTTNDFMENVDTQLKFTLELIQKKY